MGNSGPSTGSLSAPADAFDILSVGAVSSTGTIATFSSRGPTYDGRIKPEVCAQGVGTFGASSGSDNAYTYANGTSLSCPLVAGAAAVLLQARPYYTPQMVRQALMETATRADSPDNDYGWGIIDLYEAISWGVNFYSDHQIGPAPFAVQFYDSSTLPSTIFDWDFGDGYTSSDQNPVHEYTSIGAFDVSLTIENEGNQISRTNPNYIITVADTIVYSGDTLRAGIPLTVTINLTNTQPLRQMYIPLDWSEGSSGLVYEGFSAAGLRTDGFNISRVAAVTGGAFFNLYTFGDFLPPGSGPVLEVYFEVPSNTPEQYVVLDSATISSRSLTLFGDGFDYQPVVQSGAAVIDSLVAGDANDDGTLNIADAAFIIKYIFDGTEVPNPLTSGDANGDGDVNIADASHLINYIFFNGLPPARL